jgi:predicted KAP-like P-loop ATPase
MHPLPPASLLSETLLSDSSVHTLEEDEFQRYPFAQRIAATISTRRDATSLVIGLYGKWGSGKTSVFNFIRHELISNNSDIITMVFNPWLFSGEEQLLLGFFAEFSEVLAPIGQIGAQAAAKALNEYSKKVAARAGLLRQDASEAHAKVFEASAALEGFQKQLHKILHASSKRILVLIDDIDRLDKHEIQALLRLVKLTADFPYTTYLLAFDDAIVARALGERYPAGGKAAGKRFLEKIIQVPLRVPVIQKEAMLRYFDKRLKRVLYLTDNQITEHELSRLTSTLSDSVLHQPITPRDVTRYANTLSIVMPLLRDEANMVELMLIEALKIFFPASYKLIVTNQHSITGIAPDSVTQELRERYEPVFGKDASKLGNARNLVLSLFPKLQNIYTVYNFRMHNELYTTEDELYEAKSIASSYYFKRYFSYAVQEGEIPDKSFTDFLQTISQGSDEEAYRLAITMIERASEGEFLRLLKRTQSSVTSEQAPSYCTLLVRLSDRLSIQRASDLYYWMLSSVEDLLLAYVMRAPESQQFSLVQEALRQGAMKFAYSLLHEIANIIEQETTEGSAKVKAFFTPARQQQLSETFITRILQELADRPLYQEYKSNSTFLYSVWQTARGSAQLNEYLQAILANHPEELLLFLRYLCPHGFAGTAEYYGHLDESIYKFISDMFDAEALYQVAKRLIGETELLPYRKERFGSPNDEQRLHEFIHLHNAASPKAPTIDVDSV